MLLLWETNEAIKTSALGRDRNDANGNEALAKVYRFVVVKANLNQDSTLEVHSTGYSMCL